MRGRSQMDGRGWRQGEVVSQILFRNVSARRQAVTGGGVVLGTFEVYFILRVTLNRARVKMQRMTKSVRFLRRSWDMRAHVWKEG